MKTVFIIFSGYSLLFLTIVSFGFYFLDEKESSEDDDDDLDEVLQSIGAKMKVFMHSFIFLLNNDKTIFISMSTLCYFRKKKCSQTQ